MRKLMLGLGLLAVSRVLARRGPAGGLGRFTSLPSLAAIIAGAAATQMMSRSPNGAPTHKSPAGNNRNHSFLRRFSPQPNNGEAT
jgi:hypothetical protein